ncbi:MAG: ABC transporter permease [Chitinispirillaceae bacterium]|nr:ABC transporter permease [Chitinispirillaceae bacterium]
MIRRLAAIVTKEFLHIVRDWQTLMIVLLMPVVMMFLYGYALTMDLSDIPLAIIDPQGSRQSARIAASLDASPFFAVRKMLVESNDPAEVMKRSHVKAVVRLPSDFSGAFGAKGNSTSVQVLIDGSDPNTATIISNILDVLILKIAAETAGIALRPAVTVISEVLYNTEQKSARFFIPGLMAIILLMISAMLTSLTLTREKESGTIEQMLVSPLRPVEIVLGKILPYCLLAMCDGAVILLVGQFVFGVECAGSIIVLATISLLYIVVALALGLLISTVAANQQQAMMIVLPVTMLPTLILSGFIFPLASIPFALRLVSKIVPATWYLEIIRAVMLKGVGFLELRQPIAVLSFMAALLILLSIKRFKVSL